MADSEIALSGPGATGGVGQITLTWSVIEASCLEYLRLDAVEIWAAGENDREAAELVGEVFGTQFVHTPLPRSETRYYWLRPRDVSGNRGEWLPEASGAGIEATTKDEVPPVDSVGPDQIQDDAVQTRHYQALSVTQAKIANLAVTTAKIANLAVTDAKIESLTADKLTAGTITATIEVIGPTITGGIIRTNAGGSRIEINSAGNRLDAIVGGVTQVALNASAAEPSGIFRSGLIEALNAFGFGFNADQHGLRASSGNGGGHGLVGVSPVAGGHAFFAAVGGFAPFTGVHDALLPVAEGAEVGEIVCSTGNVVAASGVSDALLEVEVCSQVGQRGAYGVVARIGQFDPCSMIAGLDPLEQGQPPTSLRLWIAENRHRLAVNGCGEGLILVCGRGGDIAVGDYICCSDMRGKGQRQNDIHGAADDLQRRSTVAKATQAAVFSGPDHVKLIACIYLCG